MRSHLRDTGTNIKRYTHCELKYKYLLHQHHHITIDNWRRSSSTTTIKITKATIHNYRRSSYSITTTSAPPTLYSSFYVASPAIFVRTSPIIFEASNSSSTIEKSLLLVVTPIKIFTSFFIFGSCFSTFKGTNSIKKFIYYSLSVGSIHKYENYM